MTTPNVFERVQTSLTEQNTTSLGDLAWLEQSMHPFFFDFNVDEAEALAILAHSVQRINHYPRITLIDRPERLMLAQTGKTNSIYNTLRTLPSRPNLSYVEINTSLTHLPNLGAPLEVLRFDHARKSDSELAQAQPVQVPDTIVKAVWQVLHNSEAALSQAQTEQLIQLLWQNNEEYVRVSHPERLARMIELYMATQQHDGIFFDLHNMPVAPTSGNAQTRVLFGVANPPQQNFLLQVLEVFKRLGIGIERSYMLSISNGVYPFFLATFYVNPRDGVKLELNTERVKNLRRELYNTQILSINAPSYSQLVEQGITNGVDATLVEAMVSFCHTNLAHNHPERFDPENIGLAFQNHPNITLQLLKLFYTRFDPSLTEERSTLYNQQLNDTEQLINSFNTGKRFLDESRRIIFHCALLFIRYCLKTNFFVPEKHALAFRLDPQYLESLGKEFTADLPPERPFRITFFFGRRGCGYHIGFSDIARGGWRTLMTQGRDDYTHSANTLFRENYVLAHTQHLKNKDIYEGGSKLVAILSTEVGSERELVRQQLYKLQFGFINAFLDLYVTQNGRAKDLRVVDYYGEDEPIELGPDENMHDAMIEIIAQQAVKRGYLLGAGIMSSKRIGINHKEYGVTSIGVIRFAEVTMQEALGIDMHRDPFSVKFTGGPNGDVAGNGMRLLLERCPQVQIKLIIDGTGALFDPEGLDHAALQKVILQTDLDSFDTNALHQGGFLLYRQQTRKDGLRELFKKVIRTEQGLEEQWVSNDAFYKAFNSLAFSVQADLFIPAGGRPETIDANNYTQFLDANGVPSAKVIIEGANSFITPDARLALQKHGVVIMRDASANKCGVISSSYEIMANLMLSDVEFLAHKSEYVHDVVGILNHLAEQEARLILKRHKAAAGGIPYTQISYELSREINEHYARLFNYFQANPTLTEKPIYQNALLHHLPTMISQSPTFRNRVERIPKKVQYAMLASTVAAQLVYAGDDMQAFADMVEAQLRRLEGVEG